MNLGLRGYNPNIQLKNKAAQGNQQKQQSQPLNFTANHHRSFPTRVVATTLLPLTLAAGCVANVPDGVNGNLTVRRDETGAIVIEGGVERKDQEQVQPTPTPTQTPAPNQSSGGAPVVIGENPDTMLPVHPYFKKFPAQFNREGGLTSGSKPVFVANVNTHNGQGVIRDKVGGEVVREIPAREDYVLSQRDRISPNDVSVLRSFCAESFPGVQAEDDVVRGTFQYPITDYGTTSPGNNGFIRPDGTTTYDFVCSPTPLNNTQRDEMATTIANNPPIVWNALPASK